MAENELTFEDIDKVYKRFLERTNRAEQYQFAILAFFQMRLEAMYNYLKETWDEERAQIFLRILNKMYEILGWLPDEDIQRRLRND